MTEYTKKVTIRISILRTKPEPHDWRYSAGRDVRVSSGNPYRACEVCGEMWLNGELVRPGDGRCQIERADEQETRHMNAFATAPPLAVQKVVDDMAAELARLEGMCKLLARRLNAVERLAVGDNAPVDEELNSDAYQAVRARLDADYPQRPLSERMIWADCDCERCKHLPSEQRVRLATPLKDYNPPNTLYKAMLKHIFERDAKR